MSATGRGYPAELRERAVRLVFEHQGEYPSQWKAIESISKKLAINHETLRIWVRRAETDAGDRPGLTSDERARMRELERENRELRIAGLSVLEDLYLFRRIGRFHALIRLRSGIVVGENTFSQNVIDG